MLPNRDGPTPVKLPSCFLSLDQAPFAIDAARVLEN